MSPRTRSLPLMTAVCAAVVGAGCGTGDAEGGSSTGDASDSAGPQIEGVVGFYGEHEDFRGLMEAIADGDTTAEELEHPWVAEQGHVDSAPGWDGAPPVYEMSPPAGGDHLSQWQNCTGVVYDAPVEDGNAVHSLEHGAVWLTYDPELVAPPHVAALAERVEGRDYSMMSPYPGQGVPVSLQSWGHRYQTEDPSDPNIDAYLDAYILNESFNPEAFATCSGGVPVDLETDVEDLSDQELAELGVDPEELDDTGAPGDPGSEADSGQ